MIAGLESITEGEIWMDQDRLDVLPRITSYNVCYTKLLRWEIITAVALLLGIWARIFAIAGVPILLGAIFTVHGAAGFFFTNPNGGWEYPALWIVALIALALIGDGPYALKRLAR